MRSRPQPKIRLRQKLGKYRLERRIADGSYATVFQAMDTIMGVSVSLKVPHQKFVDRGFMADFLRESQLVAAIDHPGILQIRDASVLDERFVISSALGLETLSGRLTRRMSFDTAMVMVEQILATLSFVHQRRYVHGGLHSQNVILFADGSAKLADFSTSWAMGQSAARQGLQRESPLPEQYRDTVTYQSDVYCAASIVYRLFSGHWPDTAANWPFEGAQKLALRVPASMVRWLKRGLAADPGRRFSDAEQMRKSFLRIRSEAIRFSQSQRNGRSGRPIPGRRAA